MTDNEKIFQAAKAEVEALGVQKISINIFSALQGLSGNWMPYGQDQQRSQIVYSEQEGVLNSLAGRKIISVECYAYCNGGLADGTGNSYDVVPDGDCIVTAFDPGGRINDIPLASPYKSDIYGSFIWQSGYELKITLPVTVRPLSAAKPAVVEVVKTSFWARVVVTYE